MNRGVLAGLNPGILARRSSALDGYLLRLDSTRNEGANWTAASVGQVNVADFGGLCDGVTDDTRAWAAAVTYLATLPAGYVLTMPAGTTSVCGPGTLLLPNGAILDGQGGTIKLSKQGGGTNPIVGASNATPSNITIRNLTIDCNTFGSTAWWYNTSAAPSPGLPGVAFYYCTFKSTGNVSGFSGGFNFAGSNNVIEHCTFIDCISLGTISASNSGTVGNKFLDNYIYGSGAFNQRINVNFANGSGHLIGNNVFDGGAAPTMQASNGSVIFSNTLNNITSTSSTGNFVYSIGAQSAAIGNVAYNCNFNPSITGIFNSLSGPSLISENQILNCTFNTAGVALFRIDGVGQTVCSNNVVYGSTVAGGAFVQCCLLTGSVQTVQQVITGNVFISPVTVGGTNVAIDAEGAPTSALLGIIVSDNYFYGWNLGCYFPTNQNGEVTIDANQFDTISGHCVYFGGSIVAPAVTITNNLINAGGTDAGSIAILLNNVQDFLIANNNIVSANHGTGVIRMIGSVRGKIGGNKLDTQSGAALNVIYTDSTTHGVMIDGNFLTGAHFNLSLAGVSGTDYVKANNYYYSGSTFTAL